MTDGSSIERWFPADAFVVLFLKASAPVSSTQFERIDATRWALDVSQLVVGQRQRGGDVGECALAVAHANVLDQTSALALYVKSGGGDSDDSWEYRGCVSAKCPSNAFNLRWPSSQPPFVVGVAVEPLEQCSRREDAQTGTKRDFARRVATDLWNFLKSFTSGDDGEAVLVPRNVFDAWHEKFQRKFERDPDFLTRNRDFV